MWELASWSCTLHISNNKKKSKEISLFLVTACIGWGLQLCITQCAYVTIKKIKRSHFLLTNNSNKKRAQNSNRDYTKWTKQREERSWCVPLWVTVAGGRTVAGRRSSSLPLPQPESACPPQPNSCCCCVKDSEIQKIKWQNRTRLWHACPACLCNVIVAAMSNIGTVD